MSTWKLYGEPLFTADFATPTLPKVQKVILPSTGNLRLWAIKAWIILFNNPSFTSLQMKLYSNRAGSPGKLLYTSQSVIKADIITDLNGVKDVPFIFNDPEGIYFKGGESFFAMITGSGYTGDDTTHIAWKKAWPDPIYTTNLTVTMESLHVFPLSLYLVGETLYEF